MEEDNVILTLADSSITQTDEYGRIVGLNEAGDTLENVELSRINNGSSKKRKAQVSFADDDEDDFNADALAAYTAKLTSRKFNKANVQSLKTEYKVSSDFVDGMEIPKIKKTKNKDLQSIRPIVNKLDDVPSTEAAEEEDYDLNAILNGDNSNETTNDNNQMQSNAFSSIKEIRVTSSNKVIKKKKVSFIPFSTQAIAKSVVYEDDDPELAEALNRARKQAIQKRKNETEELNYGIKEKGLLSMKGLINKETTQKMEIDESEKSFNPSFSFDIDAEGRTSEGKLVFNSTTEFASRLTARLTEKARAVAEAALTTTSSTTNLNGTNSSIKQVMNEADDVVLSMEDAALLHTEEHGTAPLGDDNSVVGMSVGSHNGRERDEEGSISQMDGQLSINGMESIYSTGGIESITSKNSKKNDDIEEDEQLEFLHRRPIAAKGLAGTLKLLQESGDLKRKEAILGRAKDVRLSDENEKGVKLDYRNEKGRKLTQKEAFRQLAYKFHGFGPGKKKLEKRKRVCYLYYFLFLIALPLIECYIYIYCFIFCFYSNKKH
jgi:hypothetical protein